LTKQAVKVSLAKRRRVFADSFDDSPIFENDVSNQKKTTFCENLKIFHIIRHDGAKERVEGRHPVVHTLGPERFATGPLSNDHLCCALNSSSSLSESEAI